MTAPAMVAPFHWPAAPSCAWSLSPGLWQQVLVIDLPCCGPRVGLKRWWVSAVVVCPQWRIYFLTLMTTMIVSLDVVFLVADVSTLGARKWFAFSIICCTCIVILSLSGCRPRRNASCGGWCRWPLAVNRAKFLFTLSCWRQFSCNVREEGPMASNQGITSQVEAETQPRNAHWHWKCAYMWGEEADCFGWLLMNAEGVHFSGISALSCRPSTEELQRERCDCLIERKGCYAAWATHYTYAATLWGIRCCTLCCV